MPAAMYLLFLYALWIFGGVDTYSLIFTGGIMLFIPIMNLFSTHPLIEERIHSLEEIEYTRGI